MELHGSRLICMKQCVGGFPCRECLMSGMQQDCSPPRVTNSVIQIDERLRATSDSAVSLIQPASNKMDIYITHLFTSFLRQHNFTAQPSSLIGKEHGDLQSLLHSSAILQHAALAVAALDLDLYKASTANSQSGRARGPSAALRYTTAP